VKETNTTPFKANDVNFNRHHLARDELTKSTQQYRPENKYHESISLKDKYYIPLMHIKVFILGCIIKCLAF